MKKNNGFTLVEISLVVGIIAILATLATPPLLQSIRRSKAAEALATMSLLRQAMKDYHITHNTYFDVASDNIQNGLPTSVAAGLPTPSTAGLEVDMGVTQYFSNAAFSIDATSPASARFTNPGPVDFIITANGSASAACSSTVTTNCALRKADVNNFRLEMDNSARIFISFDSGTTWRGY
jgi:prepilin-type N-terminal cleavage/methylation domain-containing protein